MSDPHVHQLLERWVAEGLIEAEQAASIEAAEAARPPEARLTAQGPAGATALKRSLVVEALGYLGGVLAVIAGFLAVGELWPDIPTTAELAFAAVGAVALAGTGAGVRAAQDAALTRLRSVLWLLSAGCLAVFLGVLGEQVLEWGGASTCLLASSVTTAYAALLWRRSVTPPQQLAVFTALAVLAGATVVRIDDDLAPWAPGLAVWVVSAIWATVAHRRLVRPATAGLLFSSIGLLVGTLMTMEEAAGHVLGILTVAALIAAGVQLRQVWLLGVGAVGVLIVVPQTATRYLPDSAAAPIAIFAVGLTLLGIAVWLGKRNRPTVHHP